MLKKLCVMLACLVPLTCFAEWSHVGRTSSANIYIDLSTIQARGDSTRVWRLLDYSGQRYFMGVPYLSAIQYKEIDCKNGRSRTLYKVLYSNNMRSGREVYSFNRPTPTSWIYIAPQTVDSIIQDRVCRTKS